MKCCDVPVGKMRRKISLQHRTKTSDGSGGYTNTYTEYASVFSWIDPLSGNELLRSMQLENPITHRIHIRYRTDVLGSDRIVYNDRNFNIRSIINLEEKNRFLRISAEENVEPKVDP